MPQWHTLRPSCASAGVQDQGNIVRRRRNRRNSCGSICQENLTGVVHCHRKYGDLTVCGRTAGEFRAYGGTKQDTSVGVTEKKQELFVGVRRIQRGCCS